MIDDAARIREALTDPLALCDALELTGDGRGRTWFVDGRNRIRIRCPWHDERTGSCGVSLGPDGTIRVRCFGCGATGDALSLVAVAHQLDVRRDFQQVLSIAAAVAGVSAPESAPASSPRRVQRPAKPARVEPVDPPDDGLIERVAAVLRDLAPVEAHADARRYLDERRIARGVGLGWFALPDRPEGLAPLREAIVDSVGLDGWGRCGLAWPSGVFDPRWRGRLVIPWDAPNGAVTYLVGRAMGEPRQGEARYMGLARRRPSWPWGCADLYELSGPDTSVAIVEGAIDAHSFNLLALAHGADCIAIGLPGVENWRDEWAVLARGRSAIVALDADAAGASHTPRIKRALEREARSVQVREPKRGKDWNDLLMEAI